MACVNADGTITPMAKSLLQALGNPLTPEEAAALIGVPLFRIRASLRELQAAGFVKDEGGRYRLTEQGRAKI
jgi:predicted transcriptional regulator